MSLSKYLAKFHGERIDALKAVREALKRGNKGEMPMASGSTAEVFGVGDKVVKFSNNAKEFKRRGFLDSILHENDLAPKTHLVETQKRKYMVQPRADITLNTAHNSPGQEHYLDDFYNYFDNGDGNLWGATKTDKRDFISEYMINSADELGLSAGDVGFSKNIGFYNGDPKIIDSGYETLNRAMTPAERRSALEKFISYGKRKR